LFLRFKIFGIFFYDLEVVGIPALCDQRGLCVDDARKDAAVLPRERDAPGRNTPHGAPPVFEVAAARNGTVVQEAAHAQQQAPFVLLVLAAAFPRLVFVDAVGQQRVTDSPVIAGSALLKAPEKERQQFQFECRTAFRAQRFGQRFDLAVTEVERADVVRRHTHHHP
jgi:hypothetical protein